MGVVKRDFCKNFRKKHGKYPKLTHVPLGLEGTIVDNLLIDQKTEKLYDLWEKVQFDKNFEYVIHQIR